MAEIDALPFAFAFKPDTMALVVIDMQRDFAEPGGFGASLGNDVSRVTAIVPTVKKLIEGFRAAGLPVIHTMECHRPDLSDCPPAKRNRGKPALRIGDAGPMGRVLIVGEPGTAILDELAPLPGEIVIEKPGKGAFYATGFGDELKRLGAEQLVFAGVTTEVCVQTTMREANDRGYECLLAEDATESYFPEFKAAALAMIRAQGGDRRLDGDDRPGARGDREWVGPHTRGARRLTTNLAQSRLPELVNGGWRDLAFEHFRDGITVHWLLRGSDVEPSVAILNYQPGASVPRHRHAGLETIVVLEGIQSDENGDYAAGTVVLNPVGTRALGVDEGRAASC